MSHTHANEIRVHLCDRDPNKHWKFRTRSKVDDCVKERKEEDKRYTYIRNRCERRGKTEESRWKKKEEEKVEIICCLQQTFKLFNIIIVATINAEKKISSSFPEYIFLLLNEGWNFLFSVVYRSLPSTTTEPQQLPPLGVDCEAFASTYVTQASVVHFFPLDDCRYQTTH